MTNLFKLLVIVLLLTACNEETTLPSSEFEEPDLESTMTLRTFKNSISEDTPEKIDSDIILEGYVISSDEEGNFYNTLVIVDEEGRGGLKVNIDYSGLFGLFPLGQKIYVKLKGLTAQWVYDGLEIGLETSSEDLTDAIPSSLISEYVVRSSQEIILESLIQEKTIETVSNDDINSLIQLNEVEFLSSSFGYPFHSESEAIGSGTNRNLNDEEGNKLVARISKYASFSDFLIPSTNGTITGVLQKYSSTRQLILNHYSDIEFNSPSKYLENEGAQKATLLNCVNESFDYTLKDYQNFSVNSSRIWSIESYDNNYFLELSSYQLDSELESWFIMQLNFDEASILSFETLHQYFKSNVLEIWISNTYNNNKEININDWTEITSNFTISSGEEENDDSYSSEFISSGEYTIPLTGNGFIGFRYNSLSEDNTTTIQIDNIKILNPNNETCF